MPAWLKVSRFSQTVLFGLLLFASGCLHSGNYEHTSCKKPPADQSQTAFRQCRIDLLKQALVMLGPDVDANEAARLSKEAYEYSITLAKEYEITRPPLLHNILVNIGLKKRGLCIHWTKDLLLHFEALKMKSFQFHWGVAYQGNLLREHSCVVVTAIGQDFHEGIVLDAWRNSGELYWGAVRGDEYPWQKWAIKKIESVYSLNLGSVDISSVGWVQPTVFINMVGYAMLHPPYCNHCLYFQMSAELRAVPKIIKLLKLIRRL